MTDEHLEGVRKGGLSHTFAQLTHVEYILWQTDRLNIHRETAIF